MDETGTEQTPAGAAEASAIDWNGPTARFWVDHDDRYDILLARHGDVLLAAAAPGPGERVLDIGCGCGSTTLRAAQAVAPGGGTALRRSRGSLRQHPRGDATRRTARLRVLGRMEPQ